MASGWQTNDVQTQERRNREWIARYLLGLPFPDRDDAGVAQVTPRATSFSLPGVETPVATFPPAPLVIVHKVTLTSTGDAERLGWVALHTAAFGNQDIIAMSKSIQPRETVLFDGPWFCPGATTLRVWSNGATGQLAGRVDYTVCLATTPGITPAFGRVFLSTTPTAYYTAPADVASAYVAALGMTAQSLGEYTNTIVLELLPTGQASAAQFYVANAPLPGSETDLLGGFTLQPGDAIRAWKIGPDPCTLAWNVIEFRG